MTSVDMNILDNLPIWDKKIADLLKPLGPILDLGLILVIILCIYALIQFKEHPEYKALVLAFLISP